MKFKLERTTILALILILGMAKAGFSQGLYWESNQTTGRDQKQHLTKSYAMPKMFKVEAEQTVIIRLDQEKFITVNDKDKTYSEMTFAEMESAMKGATSALAGVNEQLKAKLAEMPAEQRAMMEKMMKDKMGGGEEEVAYTVEKKTDTKTIAGFPASKYEVKHGDVSDATFWTTTAISGFDDIKSGFKAFQERMSSMAPGKAKSMAKWWSQIDGFPLEVHTEYFDQVVTKVEKKSTPVSAFEIPAGYKKVDMMNMRHGKRPATDGGNNEN